MHQIKSVLQSFLTPFKNHTLPVLLLWLCVTCCGYVFLQNAVPQSIGGILNRLSHITLLRWFFTVGILSFLLKTLVWLLYSILVLGFMNLCFTGFLHFVLKRLELIEENIRWESTAQTVISLLPLQLFTTCLLVIIAFITGGSDWVMLSPYASHPATTFLFALYLTSMMLFVTADGMSTSIKISYWRMTLLVKNFPKYCTFSLLLLWISNTLVGQLITTPATSWQASIALTALGLLVNGPLLIVLFYCFIIKNPFQVFYSDK